MTGITRGDRLRILLVALVLIFFFALLIAQFYNIQIIEAKKWMAEAKRQHFFVVKEPFMRGSFFSNTSIKQGHPENPQKLVFDIQKFHLYVDPMALPEEYKNPIITELIQRLSLSPMNIDTFRKQFQYHSRSRKLEMWLDPETRDAIMDWWIPYARRYRLPRNALFFVSDYQRSYPFGSMLGQVLHTIQETKDEITLQAIPTGGLELYFNPYLQGKQGKRRLMRSPRNAFETGEVFLPPENGSDIYLTINHCLQAIAEEEIAHAVKKSKAKSGWAVMMDPYTGHILALAQYPFFYPPSYQEFFNDPNRIEDTKVKAVMDANEPGSVMKPVTVAIALKANALLIARGEKELFNPKEKTATSDGRFPGRSKPLTDTHFHKYLNMQMGVQKSSNIYMARLVEKILNRLGREWYRQTLQDTFGLGVKTNIELQGENKGLLPTPGKKHANGTMEWSTPTPWSMAMGHNIQVNSIQLLRVHAIFANGGYLVQPTLIRKIVHNNSDGTTQVLLDNTLPERQKSFPRVLDPNIVKDVVTAMKFVTKPGGTATRGEVWGYTEAGKSGTGNKVINGTYAKKTFCSSFVGFTPLNHPAFVLVVTLDEPEYGYVPGVGKVHHGGACAAPVFRAIASRTLQYLGITPDDPYGYPPGDPRYDKNKGDWLPEARKLVELYNEWNTAL